MGSEKDFISSLSELRAASRRNTERVTLLRSKIKRGYNALLQQLSLSAFLVRKFKEYTSNLSFWDYFEK